MNYLYNGVELPDINTVWTDKVTYPYALVALEVISSEFEDTTLAYLFLSTIPITVEPYMDDGLSDICVGNGAFRIYQTYQSTEWELIEEDSKNSSTYGLYPHWTSHDILNTDGTTYLAASDPIPVGGAEPIDPTSMLMGWLVGRAVASQRGKARPPIS